jgi:translation elongation factor EF-Tu-like GTPase
MTPSPDVEAEFTLFTAGQGGRRSSPALSGYRPEHKVRDNYLTTGYHTYFDCDQVLPGQTVRCCIKFISPEAYPHCLWVGREIDVQEGSRLVGRARITKILNPVLEKHS